MTSFGYWAAQVPDARFLCCLCFEAHPIEQASRDDNGDRQDVCTDCWQQEQAVS